MRVPPIESPTYVVGCKSLTADGYGSPSFEAGLDAAQRDEAPLIFVAVTTLIRLAQVAEFPINIGVVMVYERQRVDALEERLRLRLEGTDLWWRLDRQTGELSDALSRVAEEVRAAKLYVGPGSLLSRRLHLDVARRLRGRTSCEVVTVMGH